MACLLLEADVRRLLTMDEALKALEDAFLGAARGDALNVPRQRGALRGITINTMAAISTTLDAAAVKCYPVVRQDITVGSSFTFLVYRISSGELVGVMEANALSQIRTGAASGLATRYLARDDSRVMTIFGAGWQAETQLEAMARVLPKLERVNVVGRSPERARRFCDVMSERVQLDVAVAQDAERAVSEADVITTITGSRVPVFDGRWLAPGTHINAAGSNYAEKRELDATAVKRSSRIVVDDLPLARIESGDLLGAEKEGGLDWKSVHSLSDVIARKVPARTSPDEITLFESHGLALEDLAVACRVLDLARAQGIGTEIPIK